MICDINREFYIVEMNRLLRQKADALFVHELLAQLNLYYSGKASYSPKRHNEGLVLRRFKDGSKLARKRS